ncbi:hypothetical protein QYF36_021259 [Acer negundo]|nr:hypothetical protein QYF36_021259 [Acer negundo]
MSRPGDWNCRSCSHLNFQRRDSCQRCGESRPGSSGGGDRGDFGGSFGVGGGGRGGGSSPFGFSTGPDVRPGDWYCTVGNCGAHNFASRSSCFKCGASKDETVAALAALDGNPATGFAPGLDVTSTTLLVEPNVLDAMLQGNLLATNIHINQTLFNFWPALQSKEIMKKFRRKKKKKRRRIDAYGIPR